MVLVLALVAGAQWIVASEAVGSAQSTAVGSGLTTKTFTSPGESSFVVPPGNSSVLIAAIGAQGGAGYASVGGFGASVSETVSVTPGQTLYIEVGAPGSNGGGKGGGGAGDGGGASDVRTLPAAAGLVPTDSRLLVAGGGGAGGDGGPGDVGGTAGYFSTGGTGSEIGSGGGPGGSASGGIGGISDPGGGPLDAGCSAAQAGGLGVGGAGGGTSCHGGGGGGGGYYGGGGGGGWTVAVGGGGGAGSSFFAPSATSTYIGTALQSNGEVSLTYMAGPPTATVLSPATGGVYTKGQSVSTSFSCADADGGPGISSCVDSTGHSGIAGVNVGSFDTATLGTHTYEITATSSDGQTGTASIAYTVVQPPQPPNKSGAARVSNVKAISGGVELTAQCAGTASQSCEGNATVTSTEQLNGPIPTALVASGKRHHKVIIVASATYTLAGGQRVMLKLKLNRNGQTLLTRFGKLPVKVLVTQTSASGKPTTIVNRNLTINPVAHKHH